MKLLDSSSRLDGSVTFSIVSPTNCGALSAPSAREARRETARYDWDAALAQVAEAYLRLLGGGLSLVFHG